MNSITANEWRQLSIMHKDRKVATIRKDGSCTVFAKSFLPYNLYLESGQTDDLDTRLNNLANFYYWCASRVLTLDRKHAKVILDSIGATQATTDKERAMISIAYHGVCLTDVYWIRAAKERINYDDVNLYNHSLSDAFADVCLRGKMLTAENLELIAQKDVAGDVSTSGIAPKAWVRRRGAFHLLKNGHQRDVDAELLASKIADCFCVDHVSYVEDHYAGKKVTRSRIITSNNRSIVPMEYIQVYCANREIDPVKFVLEKDAYSYYMMNILDYLIGNPDRHWGNWGFYVDNKTNRLEKLYPLMDFNKAFTAYDSLGGAICQTTTKVTSQKDAAIYAVRMIGLNQKKKVDMSWFVSERRAKMFTARLELLRDILA